MIARAVNTKKWVYHRLYHFGQGKIEGRARGGVKPKKALKNQRFFGFAACTGH